MKVVSGAGKWITILGALATLILAAGCTSTATGQVSSETIPTNATASAAPQVISGPAVQIISPSQSAKSGIGIVTVVTSVSGLKLVSPTGQANVPGQGHLIFYMDADPPTAPDKAALGEMGSWAATSDTSYTWPNVGSGQHKFSVELVNNDQTPLTPPVTSSVSVQVAEVNGLPFAAITSPRTNAAINGNDVTINTEVSNYKLVESTGQPNGVNEGHLYYFLDVAAPTTALQSGPIDTGPGTFVSTASTSYTWKGVAPGVHTFSIELMNNDSSPLNPPVTAEVSVIVRGAGTSSGGSSPANSPTSTPALAFIAITPMSQNNLQSGFSEQFSATGIYSDNSEQDLTSQVKWDSSAPGTASVSASGLAAGLTNGTTSISASFSGISSAPVTLNVYTPTRS